MKWIETKWNDMKMNEYMKGMKGTNEWMERYEYMNTW
jgi:hypothetical protein